MSHSKWFLFHLPCIFVSKYLRVAAFLDQFVRALCGCEQGSSWHGLSTGGFTLSSSGLRQAGEGVELPVYGEADNGEVEVESRPKELWKLPV